MRKTLGWLAGLTEVREAATVEEVLRASKRKTKILQQAFVILGVALTYAGFVGNSNHYSAYEAFFSWIAGTEHVGGKVLFDVFGIQPTSKSVVKLAFAMVFALIFWMLLDFNEHLSHDLLLRRIRLGRADNIWPRIYSSLLAPLRRDVEAYAFLVPSVRLDRFCRTCAHSFECPNMLENDEVYIDRRSIQIWQNSMQESPPKELAKLLSAVARCRFVHYFRTVALIAGYLGIVFYVGHRVLEFQIPSIAYKWSSPSILVVVFCFFAVWFLGHFNDPMERSNGVWGRLTTCVDSLLANMSFRQANVAVYMRDICDRDDGVFRFSRSSQDIRALISAGEATVLRLVLAQLDTLITTKLARIVCSDPDQTLNGNDYSVGVLNSLKIFFEENLPEGKPYLISHIPDVDGQFSSLKDQAAREIAINRVLKNISDIGIFALNRNDAAAQKGLLPETWHSMLIAPVQFSAEHVERIKEALVAGESGMGSLDLRCRGFIVLLSADGRIFSEGASRALSLIIQPFIHRMVFEILRTEARERS